MVGGRTYLNGTDGTVSKVSKIWVHPDYTDATNGDDVVGIARARKIIYPSEWAARSAVQDYQADPGKVVVVPFGANIEDVPPAAEVLRPRQRRLLDLTADGWTVPEIAAELKTTPERISDEKYKAVKKLQHYFAV